MTSTDEEDDGCPICVAQREADKTGIPLTSSKLQALMAEVNRQQAMNGK